MGKYNAKNERYLFTFSGSMRAMKYNRFRRKFEPSYVYIHGSLYPFPFFLLASLGLYSFNKITITDTLNSMNLQSPYVLLGRKPNYIETYPLSNSDHH